MSKKRRICLITPGHLATNPRLVKEADALTSAGYDVSVVSSRFIDWADEADVEFAGRPWKVKKVAFGSIAGRYKHVHQAVRRRACLWLFKAFGILRETAFHPVVPELTREACRVEADLYIAHNLAALPAAYRAARKHNALLGFDAEDFHSGELVDSPENMLSLRLTREIEGHYLPICDYVTAASPGIAQAYVETYGIEKPVVVLNVFPKSEVPAPLPIREAESCPSLYWFSQTIGPDRGLELVVEAIGMSRSRPIFYLRGNSSFGYGERLLAFARHHGVADRIRLLPPVAPQHMISLAARYDVGLASEPGHTKNNQLALSNKLFTFILAGVPVLASATKAQEALENEMPGALFLYSQRDPSSLANRMDELLLNPEALVHARQAAWRLGQNRFNWDCEQQVFLRAVDDLLSQRS